MMIEEEGFIVTSNNYPSGSQEIPDIAKDLYRMIKETQRALESSLGVKHPNHIDFFDPKWGRLPPEDE